MKDVSRSMYKLFFCYLILKMFVNERDFGVHIFFLLFLRQFEILNVTEKHKNDHGCKWQKRQFYGRFSLDTSSYLFLFHFTLFGWRIMSIPRKKKRMIWKMNRNVAVFVVVAVVHKWHYTKTLETEHKISLIFLENYFYNSHSYVLTPRSQMIFRCITFLQHHHLLLMLLQCKLFQNLIYFKVL